MPQSFSSQNKTYITLLDLQSRSEFLIDLIVDLQNKYMQQLHLLALHLEIEGYTIFHLYFLLEFLSSFDLNVGFRLFRYSVYVVLSSYLCCISLFYVLFVCTWR